MTTYTMPYFWDMSSLKLHNKNNGYHFFSPENMRFSKSRVQTVPPYGGRVFVTSERPWGQPSRLYSVRCIKPGGGIDTLNRYKSRYDAHAFAKWYAELSFVQFDNKSIAIPLETEKA